MKKRLDVYLVENGYVSAREKAKELIKEGNVFVNEKAVLKAGTFVEEDCKITVNNMLPFVSRGGLKLQKALESFNIDLKNKICVDIGASTGGFTDCMLKSGAKKVYSIDVGENQLDESLKNDERVIVLEKTNSRYLTEEQLPEKADFLSADVSFISLKLALDTVIDLIGENAELVTLVKPQFEAGKSNIGKNGVVKDRKVQKNVIIGICDFMKERGLSILGVDFSPIKGQQGNIEYLLYMTKKNVKSIDFIKRAEEIVSEAHKELKTK